MQNKRLKPCKDHFIVHAGEERNLKNSQILETVSQKKEIRPQTIKIWITNLNFVISAAADNQNQIKL